MKKTIPIYLLIAAVLLASSTSQAFAAAPSQIAPDSNVLTTDYQFQLVNYSPNTYVKFGSNFYADGVQISGTYVNFTNMAIGSASNPAQTFGVGVESGNATISNVAAGVVTLTMSCASSTTCYAYYYYAGGLPVYAVETTIAGTTTPIQSAAFLTDTTSFNAAPGPIVYQNSAGSYLKVKVTYALPTTISFYLGTPVSNGGGSSGDTGNGNSGTGTNQQGGSGGGGSGEVGGGGSSGGQGGTGSEPAASPIGLDVSVPAYSVMPGESQTQQITISWKGATKIIIQSIEFDSNPGYFTVGKNFPFAAVMNEKGELTTQVPLTVTLPKEEQGLEKTVQMRVTAIAGSASTAQQVVPIYINLQPTNNLAIYSGVLLIGIIGVVAALRKRR